MVKNLPSNARDLGLILDQGNWIPCAAWQLSPSTAAEPSGSRTRAPELEKPLHAATGKCLHTAMKAQHSPNYINNINNPLSTNSRTLWWRITGGAYFRWDIWEEDSKLRPCQKRVSNAERGREGRKRLNKGSEVEKSFPCENKS